MFIAREAAHHVRRRCAMFIATRAANHGRVGARCVRWILNKLHSHCPDVRSPQLTCRWRTYGAILFATRAINMSLLRSEIPQKPDDAHNYDAHSTNANFASSTA